MESTSQVSSQEAAERFNILKKSIDIYTGTRGARIKRHVEFLKQKETYEHIFIISAYVGVVCISAIISNYAAKFMLGDNEENGKTGTRVGSVAGTVFFISEYVQRTEKKKEFTDYFVRMAHDSLISKIHEVYGEDEYLKEKGVCPINMEIMLNPVMLPHHPDTLKKFNACTDPDKKLPYPFVCDLTAVRTDENGRLIHPTGRHIYQREDIIPMHELSILIHKRLRHCLRSDIQTCIEKAVDKDLEIMTSYLQKIDYRMKSIYSDVYREMSETMMINDDRALSKYISELQKFHDIVGGTIHEDPWKKET